MSIEQTKQPMISFCVPTYNRARRVYECVSRILEYVGDEIEVIVSNNNSTDNTLETLGAIKDNRLRVSSNQRNINSLNWPLAVSYAKGKWAVLMSDEDIVLLENIPYYFRLLERADSDGVGVVIYDFPPIVKINFNYKCKNMLDCFRFASSNFGHITGAAINTRYFEFNSLESFKGFGWIDPLRMEENYEITDPSLPEPHIEILLRTMLKSGLMLSRVALCAYGRRESFDFSQGVNLKSLGGSLRKKDNCYAYLLRSERFLKACSSNALPMNEVYSWFMHLLHMVAGQTAASLNGLAEGVATGYMREIMERYKDRFDYTHEKVLETVVGYVKDFTARICGRMAGFLSAGQLSAVRFAPEALENILYGKTADIHLPAELTGLPEREYITTIALGELLFQTAYRCVELISYYTSPADGSEIKNSVLMNPRFDDILELRKTLEIAEDMNGNKYETVLAKAERLTVMRKHYILGDAYFRMKDFSGAVRELKIFLSHVENPRNVTDIITGLPSVINAYYYLGWMYQNVKSDLGVAVRYYAKLHALAGESLQSSYLDRMCPAVSRL